MSANIQAVSPAESGSSARAAFYGLITFALLSVDAYHVFNYVFHHMSSDSTAGMVFNALLAAAIALLAFVIKPATILFVNAMRLRDPFIIRLGTGLMLAALLCGVFIATSSSQNTLSEVRSNDLDTHESRLQTLKMRENDARSRLNLAKTMARTMEADQAAGYLAAAQARYSRERVKIGRQRSEILNNKPLAQTHNAGFVAVSTAARDAVFSAFITLAGVVSTIFGVMHLKAEHRIPAFSLASKLNHEWESYRGNYRSASFEVNPLRGLFNGVFFGHKRDVIDPSSQIHSPRTIGGSANEKQPPADDPTDSDNAVEPAPEHDKKHVKCPSCGGTYALTNAVLTAVKSGKIRCGGCGHVYIGRDHLTDLKTAHSPQISEKFPGNSPEIFNRKQQDSSLGNLGEISGEFEGNSGEIPNDGKFPKKTTQSDSVDLSHIASSDPADKKLNDLEQTIDQLSSDPKANGLKFSPTQTTKALHLRYDRVKEVFERKQQEGKISMTKPYKIVYVGAEQ